MAARSRPVTAHWGTAADLEEVLAAGVDGLEHVGRILDAWPDGALRTLVDRRVPLTPTLAVMEVKLDEPVMRVLRERVREAHAAGVPIVAGSDAGMPGVPFGAGLHRELELLAASGLGARELGAIVPGRVADLVALRGDPLRDVGAVRAVVLVYRAGRLVVDRRTEAEGR